MDARADELAISSGVGRPGGIIKRAAVDIKTRASATGIAPHSQRCGVWHRRVWYRPAAANFRAPPTPLLLHWAGRVLMPRRPRSGRLLAIDLVVLDHADRRHVIDLLQRKRASAVQRDDLSLRMHDRAAHDGHTCLQPAWHDVLDARIGVAAQQASAGSEPFVRRNESARHARPDLRVCARPKCRSARATCTECGGGQLAFPEQPPAFRPAHGPKRQGYGCRVRHVSASGVTEESAMQWCVHVRVRAEGREGRSISGVAGKPTTTTASFRSRQRRENAGILAGLYSMIGIMGESSSPSTCTARRATKPASFELRAERTRQTCASDALRWTDQHRALRVTTSC